MFVTVASGAVKLNAPLIPQANAREYPDPLS